MTDEKQIEKIKNFSWKNKTPARKRPVYLQRWKKLRVLREFLHTEYSNKDSPFKTWPNKTKIMQETRRCNSHSVVASYTAVP